MARGGDGGIGPMRQLATLNRIARIAIQDMALQPMLQRIVDILHEDFDWEFIACVSLDRPAGRFRCEAVRSALPTEIVVGYERELGSGIVGECAQRGLTLDLDDIRLYPGAVDTLGGTRAELCVPVLHEGEVLAVLNAESRQVGAFRGQRALLETVAGQVAGMIRIARLLDELQRANSQLRDAYARVEEQSRVDGLTGLANRRSFDHALGRAIEAARTGSAPLSLLMIDVDHFKAYNDSLGHVAGDACLRLVAALLLGLLAGENAILARYGGEEFAAVLPGAEPAAAAAIAERLRAGVADYGVAHPNAPAARVTVSIGTASVAVRTGADPAALVAAADTALYVAKRAGRNRVAAAPAA